MNFKEMFEGYCDLVELDGYLIRYFDEVNDESVYLSYTDDEYVTRIRFDYDQLNIRRKNRCYIVSGYNETNDCMEDFEMNFYSVKELYIKPKG